eukprot:PhM_4_TR16239/c0_g1_i1/m.98603
MYDPNEHTHVPELADVKTVVQWADPAIQHRPLPHQRLTACGENPSASSTTLSICPLEFLQSRNEGSSIAFKVNFSGAVNGIIFYDASKPLHTETEYCIGRPIRGVATSLSTSASSWWWHEEAFVQRAPKYLMATRSNSVDGLWLVEIEFERTTMRATMCRWEEYCNPSPAVDAERYILVGIPRHYTMGAVLYGSNRCRLGEPPAPNEERNELYAELALAERTRREDVERLQRQAHSAEEEVRKLRMEVVKLQEDLDEATKYVAKEKPTLPEDVRYLSPTSYTYSSQIQRQRNDNGSVIGEAVRRMMPQVVKKFFEDEKDAAIAILVVMLIVAIMVL